MLLNVTIGQQLSAGSNVCSIRVLSDFYQATSGHWMYCLPPDDKTARKVNIEIGRQNPQQYEIHSGLKPGDHVIINGYDKFGDVEERVSGFVRLVRASIKNKV